MEIAKLHIGCGDVILPGFINIDILESPGVDVVADIRDLPYDHNSIELIYSCANLDHLSRHDWKEAMRHWYDILKPGGLLRLSVGDFEAICKQYMQNKNIDELIGLTLGGQKDRYDWHGMMFDYDYLKGHLQDIGFDNVARYNWEDSYMGIDDFSRAYLPHMDFDNGRLMVLNMEAHKP
jgi:predicted SAM-dependent methyltransferase